MWIARCLTVLLLGFFTLENRTVSAKQKKSFLCGNHTRGRLEEVIHNNSHKTQHSSSILTDGVESPLDSSAVRSVHRKDGRRHALQLQNEGFAGAVAASGRKYIATGTSTPETSVTQEDGNDSSHYCGSKSECFSSSSDVESRLAKRRVKGSQPMVVDLNTLTTTITHTVTIPGPTVTLFFISTTTQTLTFIDPTAKTQTRSVTVISCTATLTSNTPTITPYIATVSPVAPRTLVQRAMSPLGSSIYPQKVFRSDGKLRRRAELSLQNNYYKTTATIDATTTIILTLTKSKTIFITLFASTTIAPNATTTVFNTTTSCSTSLTATELSSTSTVSGTSVTSTLVSMTATASITSTSIYTISETSLTSSTVNTIAPTSSSTTSTPLPSSSTTTAPVSATVSSSSTLSASTETTPLPSSTSVTAPASPTSSATTEISSNTATITTPYSSSSTRVPTTTLSQTITNSLSTTSSNNGQTMATTSSAVTTGDTTTTSSTQTKATPTTTNLPQPNPTPSLTNDQIAALVVGIVLFLLLLIIITLLIRNWIMRRRQRFAEQRHTISAYPASSQAAAAINGMMTDTNDSDTGEGQVRIVIHPVPRSRSGRSQFWPLPPGHSGRRYTFYVEQTTTGETTPRNGNLNGTGETNTDHRSDASEYGSHSASSPTVAMGPAGASASRTWFGSSRFGRAI